MPRQIILLTGGAGLGSAKTAINLIRYRPDEVVAVWDPAHHGKTSYDIFGLGGSIPVIGTIDEAPAADTVVVGIAPAGGRLPAPMRRAVLEALAHKMTVVSGLHEFLGDDPEIAALAQQHGATVQDVRRNNERDVAKRVGLREGCLRIQTVGHDCNVGKMVVSLELSMALRSAGYDAKFVATGQTGIMIEGDGCPIDAVVVDFVNGAAEKLVLAQQHHEIILIEGQGSLVHPRYSPVTLGLLHGALPDGLILCYECGRSAVMGMESIPIPPLPRLINLYETMANEMHPCCVVGIGMNSRQLSAAAADDERRKVRDELGLPICDVIRHGPAELVEAVLALKRKLGK